MASSGPQPQQIDLSKLSLEQLNQLKQQFEEEVQSMERHLMALKEAQRRYQGSRGCVSELDASLSGRGMLVPLNQSLYVPGKVVDADKLLVDIGTGYFVEKTLAQTREYLDRKLTVVNKNAESAEQVLNQKEQSCRAIVGTMQQRMISMQRQQAEVIRK